MKTTIWASLIRIHKIAKPIYMFLTMPFVRWKATFIVPFPFTRFYFRPLYLSDWYLALRLHEPYVRSAIKASLCPPSVFIDVGAHIGYYTVLASKLVGRNGLVIAIEPDSRNLAVLYKNCSHLTNVVVHEAAATSAEGTITIRHEQDPLYTRITVDKSSDATCKQIDCMTLDSLIPVLKSKSSKVLIKIDVEVGEMDVLKGSMQLIKQMQPTIIIEAEYPEEIAKFLGFEASQLFTCYYLFKPPQIT